MDASQIVVPEGTDYHWLMNRATKGKPHDLSAEPQADGSILLIYDRSYDLRVKAERDGYAANYLEVLRPRALKRIGEAGREKALNNFAIPTPGGPMPMLLDFTTECRLDALCRYLDRNSTVAEVHWDKTGEGDFVTFSREQGYGMFDLASGHIQGCFTRRKSLTDRVNAAASIDDPVFGEIETGWPGDAA